MPLPISKKAHRLSMAFCLIASSAAAVHATDSATESSAADDATWRFQATPYVWLLGMQGSITAQPFVQNAHFSQSFSDIWSNLKVAAFLTGTARKGRYVLQADSSYASLSDTATLPYGFKARAKVQQTSLTLTGGYNWALSPEDSLDLLGGFRWWDLKSSVKAPALGISQYINKSFADPILAVRWRHQFNDRWSSLIYGDYGGFSVGSKSTWQMQAVVNYHARDNIYLSAGYRVLDVDYRESNKRLDARMSGPVLGVTFRF